MKSVLRIGSFGVGAVFLSLALAVAGCGDDGRTDGGTGTDSGTDAGTDTTGSDTTGTDTTGTDTTGTDTVGVDVPTDTGTDTGTDAPVDVPPVDSGIEEAKGEPDGDVDVAISGVWVTYIKPTVDTETSGFFVQQNAAGPALYVNVDPTTLDPAPAVGDEVSFNVDTMATSGMQRRAEAVSGLTVASSGNDIATLVQDVNASDDLVSALDDYDSEILTTSVTIDEDFGFAGGGHQAAVISTTGVTGDDDLRLRLPETVLTESGLSVGCTANLPQAWMWRFNGTAQVSVWETAQITDIVCPAPQVVSATSASATEAIVTFDREIDPASVMADGSQFTMDGGLTVSAATVDGMTVTLTTSAQDGSTTYTVTVAATVTDTMASGVDAAANTAMFVGFLTRAVVRINEVTANVTGGCDLIELRVVSGGTIEGFELFERTTSIYTFPALTLAANDYIVVHTNHDSATCNPATATEETTGPAEQPTATHANNFDTAYDFYSEDNGLTATDNVFTVFDPTMTIIDGVLVAEDVSDASAGASETAAATLAAATEWEMVGGGVPAGGFVNIDFRTHAVQDLDVDGSMQRINDMDTNTLADWSVPAAGGDNPAATWGANNVGQTDFP